MKTPIRLRAALAAALFLGGLSGAPTLAADPVVKPGNGPAASPSACPPNTSCVPPSAPGPSPEPPKTCGPNPGGPTCGGSGPAGLGNGSGTNQGVGNPINVINGNKYQVETDMPALPGVLGLELVRHYNSSWRALGYIGYGWHLSYETDLFVVGNTVQIHQADGAALIFNRDPNNPSSCSSTNPANGRIQIRTTPRGEEFVWVWTNGRKLAFNSQGKLESITAPTGEFVTLQYSPKSELLKVTDPQGRSLSMEYAKANTSGFKGIVAIQSPLGRFELQHNNDLKHPGLGNLVAVTAPQAVPPGATPSTTPSPIRRYHYGADSGESSPNFAHHLTGISLQGQDAQGKPQLQRLNTWGYDSNGRGILSVKGVPRQTDAKGQTVPGTGIEQVNLDFQKAGKTVLINSLGQTTTYTHANVAQTFRLLEVRGSGCVNCGPSNIRYGYDKLGRLTEETTLTPSGQPERTTKMELDSLGRVVRVSTISYRGGKAQAAQQTLRYEYAGDGSQPTLVARPSVVWGKEHAIRTAYNAFGQPTSVTEEGYSPLDAKGAPNATPITRSTTYTYQVINGRSLLVEFDGPLANGPKGTPEDSDITRYVWNAHGDAVTQIVYPMGLTAKLQYDNEGDASGSNPSQRITQYTGIDGVVTKLAYNRAGGLALVDRAGVVTRYTVDTHNRVTQVLSATGERVDMAYDLAGHLAAISDPQNNRIQLQRNLEGELSQAQLLNPDGSAAQQPVRYNEDGTQASNQGGKDTVLAGVRQLIESAQASSNVARPDVSPAPFAQLLARWQQEASQAPTRTSTSSAVDAQGLITTYWRNDFGELLRVFSPVTGTTDYRYNSAGQLMARVQQDGGQAVYQRDAAGRVVAVKATNSTGAVDEDAHITWGAANKPSRIQYAAGEERFVYDAAGRLTQHSQTIDGQQFTLTYAFNTAGQLVSKTLPDGQVLAYRYRGSQHPRAGLLESVWLQSGGLKSGYGLLDRPVVQGLNDEKDSFALRRFSYGNGLTNEFKLDAYGRVISAGNAQVGLAQLRYGDMAAASHTQQDRGNGEPAQVTTQHPVLLGQQAQEQAARTLISQLKGQSTQWLGSPKDELAQTLGLPDVQHDFNDAHFDALGRQTSQGIDRYAYDSLGRLTQLKRLQADTGKEQAVASYRYNVFGQRIAKTVARTDGKGSRTTYYFYDGSQLVAETSDEGKLQSQYVWLNDKPVGLLKSGHLYAVHTDHRNAPLAVTDEARTVVWQAQVADYLRSAPAQGGQLGQVEFNLRGSNQYFDAESGLHYNTNRYFDPVAQRYLSPDPMGLAVGPDLYAFALNRPHGLSDPLGLAPVSNPGGGLAGWTYEDKLKEIITRAIPLLPTEIGTALQEMVQPANLALMGTVLAGFIAIQATPFGWIADAALLGYGAWMIGSGITELIRTLINLHNDTNNAKCEADLQAAATRLAKGFVTGSGEVVGGLAGVWGARTSGGLERIANGIRTLLEYGKRNFGPRGPIVVSGNTGTSVGTSALTPGLGGTITQAQMPRPFAWGQGPRFTQYQGGPWEVMVESLIRGSVRFLKPNFQAFDHYVRLVSGQFRMISAKTLDTNAPSYRTPSAIASRIRTFVNDAVNFVTDTDPALGITINRSQIATREVQLAIPSTTNAAQWAAIRTEIAAAAARGVDIIVTVITP